MKIISLPARDQWKTYLKRPIEDQSHILSTAKDILEEVRMQGDDALRSLARKFHEPVLQDLMVSSEEIRQGEREVTDHLKQSIQTAYKNIKAFHEKQVTPIEVIETMPGITCWRKSVGIEKVGLYIPGGTAPLFSTVLMLGIPAKIAGCREVIMCTPPMKDGRVHPAILYAAKLVGITTIIKAGGAQAIAAMAFGTASVPVVHKIFGPGNAYVTAAKQLVQMQGVAIDMPAGPSEVCVLADETSHAGYIAADLLSQAEHGADSQVMLVSCDADLVQQVMVSLEQQLAALPRKDLARKALDNSRAFIVSNREEAIDLVNAYAPEHLVICCSNALQVADQIINAGSVFIGKFTPESVGDYASGTNHTLPTNGFSRAYSGVSVDSFVKKITFQQLSEEGLNNIAPTVMSMAEAEGMVAHSNAVRIRLESK